MTPGKIVVLNGVSSAGKSSLARTLQEISPEPWFHLSLDTFDSMIHSRYLEDVSTEQFLESIMWLVRALHASARAISATGHHVVIDTVFERPEWRQDCLDQLKGCPVLYVGVHCPPRGAGPPGAGTRRPPDRARCTAAQLHPQPCPLRP